MAAFMACTYVLIMIVMSHDSDIIHGMYLCTHHDCYVS
jgi:hypothetical protein